MLEVHAIPGPTGRLLKEMLDEKGLLGGRVRGVVNYGHNANPRNLPTLNAHAGAQDKCEELSKLDEAGVPIVPMALDYRRMRGAYLGRSRHHTRGRDIHVYQDRQRPAHDHDFYTQLVPKAAEVRIWVFRNRILGTYEKVLEYAGRNRRNPEIWNWGNGYAYKFVQPDEVSQEIKTIAKNAVAAIDLDFGAVDILLDPNHKYYVLEVNSAPGVQDRRQGFTSLVNNIERWVKEGFPARE